MTTTTATTGQPVADRTALAQNERGRNDSSYAAWYHGEKARPAGSGDPCFHNFLRQHIVLIVPRIPLGFQHEY